MHKHIHLVGIRGVGMTALAIILNDNGYTVTGSDISESYVTDQALELAGIKVSDNFSSKNITSDIDIVVFSGAYHPEKNPELIQAIKMNIPHVSQQEMLKETVKDKSLIAVAGVGGKTTTSAMLAHILRSSGKDAGYFVGAGSFNKTNRPGSWGKDNLFVAEADEYANRVGTDNTPKLLLLTPQNIILTHVFHDHPDIYKDESTTEKTFLKFVKNIKPGGTVYINYNDPLSLKIVELADKKYISIGRNSNADWHIKDIIHDDEHTNTTLIHDGKELSFSLPMIADYNIENASLAAAAAFDQGVKWKDIVKALSTFAGVSRRQEFIGKYNGALLYDDYGHHPHEVKETIKAFKSHFPHKKLWVLFESHTFTRTSTFYEEFTQALSFADRVSIMPIFSSARERKSEFNFSEGQFADDVSLKGTLAEAMTFEEAPNILTKELSEDYVLLTMGAGIVYKLYDKLLKN